MNIIILKGSTVPTATSRERPYSAGVELALSNNFNELSMVGPGKHTQTWLIVSAGRTVLYTAVSGSSLLLGGCFLRTDTGDYALFRSLFSVSRELAAYPSSMVGAALVKNLVWRLPPVGAFNFLRNQCTLSDGLYSSWTTFNATRSQSVYS